MSAEGNLDMNALLQQASAMQEQLMSSQAELAEETVEGSAGGGLVRATVSGTGELEGLTIQPEACDPADTETLADLVVAAVRDATTSAEKKAREQVGGLLGGLGGAGGLEGLGGMLPGQGSEQPIGTGEPDESGPAGSGGAGRVGF